MSEDPQASRAPQTQAEERAARRKKKKERKKKTEQHIPITLRAGPCICYTAVCMVNASRS